MSTIAVLLPTPSAGEDAELLRKACQGWGTDEQTLIDILAHRDASQRQQIIRTYEELYNENLINRLESELSGGFEKAMHRWMLDPIERGAIMANDALKNGPDYRTLVETACINSADELLAVKRAYQGRFGHSLEEDIASNTSGNLRQLLVGLVSTYRYEGKDVDNNLALSEANVLHEAFKEKAFSNVEVIRVFTTRSRNQLIATFNRYRDEHGASISKVLSRGSPDTFALALRIVVRCFASPHKYFEKLLRSALNELALEEDVLTRVIVTRAERDLKVIKKMYEERVNESLGDALRKQTTGHYRDFLLALIGN